MIPTPETLTAWLVNDRGRATLHTYVERVVEGDVAFFLYRCAETGTLRVWGNAKIVGVLQ